MESKFIYYKNNSFDSSKLAYLFVDYDKRQLVLVFKDSIPRFTISFKDIKELERVYDLINIELCAENFDFKYDEDCDDGDEE